MAQPKRSAEEAFDEHNLLTLQPLYAIHNACSL
jgi:hypothetical protein